VYVAALARYIHPAGMGKIATATSLVSILILIANFGLGQVIIRDVASDKKKAAVYVPNVLALRALLSVVFWIVIFGITRITQYSSDTILVIYIYGAAYVFDVFTDVVISIFNAYEEMEYQAGLQIGRDVINIGLSLGAIYMGASLTVIVLVSAVASLLKLVASLAVLRWRFIKPELQIDRRLCLQLLKVALPFAALTFIIVVQSSIDTILLSLYRPEQEVGWFSAANGLIAYLLLLPAQFLQAIFPVFARFLSLSEDALQQAYRTSFKYLLLLGFPLWVGTIATADHVIVLVFGPDFEKSVLSLQILAFTLFWMYGYTNGALLTATGGQTILVALEGLSFVVNIIVAFLLIPRYGHIGASIAAISSGVLLSFPLVLICHRRLRIRVPYALAIKSLVASICMGLIVAQALRMQINLFVTIFVFAPIVYGGLLLLFRAVGREDISMLTQLMRKRSDIDPT
jgi:O-antigen/teichoic acid export membrane protein